MIIRGTTGGLILIAALANASAQEKSKIQDLQVDNIQVQVEVQHIQLSFVVRDRKGNFIRDLAAHDFVIWEDGTERKIVALKEQEVPISTVILVDTSLSIGSHLESAVKSALDFFTGLENENTALAVFSESPRVLLDWDDARPDLSTLLTEMRLEGKTALYDSVISISKTLFLGRGGRKLIVLFTDGINTLGNSSFREMIEVTRELGITLYPIIYTNETIESYRRKLRLSGARTANLTPLVSDYFHNYILLQNDFQEESLRYGGRAIFSNAFADLNEVYRDIIHEMKSHYVVLYQSDRFDESETQRQVRISTRHIPGKIFIDVSR